MTKDFHNEPEYQSEKHKSVRSGIQTSDPSYRPGSAGTGGSRTGALILSIIAILIAIGVCIFTWVVYNDMSKVQRQLETKNTEVNALINQAASKFDSVTKEKQAEMQAEITKLQTQMKTFLSENAEQLEKQKALLKQNIDSAVQDAEAHMQKLVQQTANHKQQWAIDEIEYMIRLANLNLTLGQNYDQTLQLLSMADKNLAALNNPALANVRRAVANDITQLRAAPDIDRVGLVSKIDSISNQVQRLSILPNKQFSKQTITEQKEPDTQETWRAHVNKTMNNLRSMFVVRKLDGPIMPMLTPAQLVYLKENIRLKLSQAEWAALHHESDLYEKNLQLASEWLNQYKNHDLAAVKSLQSQIAALEKVNVQPNRPKVLASLTEITKTLETQAMRAAPVSQGSVTNNEESQESGSDSAVSDSEVSDSAVSDSEVSDSAVSDSEVAVQSESAPQHLTESNGRTENASTETKSTTLMQAPKISSMTETSQDKTSLTKAVSTTTATPEQSIVEPTVKSTNDNDTSGPAILFEEPSSASKAEPSSASTEEFSGTQNEEQATTSTSAKPARSGQITSTESTADDNTGSSTNMGTINESASSGLTSPESISATQTDSATEEALEQTTHNNPANKATDTSVTTSSTSQVDNDNSLVKVKAGAQ